MCINALITQYFVSYIPCRFRKCLVFCIIVSTLVLLLRTSSSYIKQVKRHMVVNQDTCRKYFGKQYVEEFPVCSKSSNHAAKESIVCERHPVSSMMAKCSIRGFVFEKGLMLKPQPKLRLDALKVHQVEGEQLNCPSPSLDELYSSTEESDHVRQLVKKVIQRKPLKSSECKLWLNGTVYVFGGDHHIYFRFLGWYSLFKTIYYDNNENSNHVIVRFTLDADFDAVEKRIFPNLTPLSDLRTFPVCIQNAVLVPRSFSSTPFRCKMELLGFCSDCLTLDFDEPTFFKFRNAMLQACSIDPNANQLQAKKNMLVILRKPYKRYEGDTVRVFERVMINGGELLSALRSNFSSFNILPVYMEDLTLCQQINVSSSADVFMGIHGAGMSHLWWTPKGATVMELMPDYKSSKPSFEILSRILKTKYVKVRVDGENEIIVNVDDVIVKLKMHIYSYDTNRLS